MLNHHKKHPEFQRKCEELATYSLITLLISASALLLAIWLYASSSKTFPETCVKGIHVPKINYLMKTNDKGTKFFVSRDDEPPLRKVYMNLGWYDEDSENDFESLTKTTAGRYILAQAALIDGSYKTLSRDFFIDTALAVIKQRDFKPKSAAMYCIENAGYGKSVSDGAMIYEGYIDNYKSNIKATGLFFLFLGVAFGVIFISMFIRCFNCNKSNV
jgi:hypothetical protein